MDAVMGIRARLVSDGNGDAIELAPSQALVIGRRPPRALEDITRELFWETAAASAEETERRVRSLLVLAEREAGAWAVLETPERIRSVSRVQAIVFPRDGSWKVACVNGADIWLQEWGRMPALVDELPFGRPLPAMSTLWLPYPAQPSMLDDDSAPEHVPQRVALENPAALARDRAREAASEAAARRATALRRGERGQIEDTTELPSWKTLGDGTLQGLIEFYAAMLQHPSRTMMPRVRTNLDSHLENRLDGAREAVAGRLRFQPGIVRMQGNGDATVDFTAELLATLLDRRLVTLDAVASQFGKTASRRHHPRADLDSVREMEAVILGALQARDALQRAIPA